jgi:hypothetical protein
MVVALSPAAVNVLWKSDFGIWQETGVTGNFEDLLPAGSIIQLINAGANGVPDALNLADPNGVGGDDSLLASLASPDIGGGVGGVFSSGPTIFPDVAVGDSLFIRAFNGPAIADSLYYGNGPGVVMPSDNTVGNPLPAPHIVAWDNGVTDIVIPEPSTILLALAGLLLFARRLRRK